MSQFPEAIDGHQLATMFERTSFGRVRLKEGTDLGSVDHFQVAAGTAGVDPWSAAYDYRVAGAGVDLTDFAEVRLSIRVDVVGAGTERCVMEYSLDGSVYVQVGSYLLLSTTGLKRTDWVTIPPAALTLTKWHVGIGFGNDITGPTLSVSVIDFRR